jgi:hypothetical protein
MVVYVASAASGQAADHLPVRFGVTVMTGHVGEPVISVVPHHDAVDVSEQNRRD